MKKDKNDDAISYIESMYEETKYRELKDSLLTDMRKEIKDLLDNERINSNQIDCSVSDTNYLDDKIKKQENIIRELEERLIKKDDIIFLLAKKLSNLEIQSVPYKPVSPWLLDKSDEKLLCSDENSIAKDISNISEEKTIDNDLVSKESAKLNIELQLISIREKYKERYYETRFDKINNEIKKSQGNLDLSKDDDEMSNENSNLADRSNLTLSDDKIFNFKKLKKSLFLLEIRFLMVLKKANCQKQDILECNRYLEVKYMT